jgi:hypothetical protein
MARRLLFGARLEFENVVASPELPRYTPIRLEDGVQGE